MKLSKFYPLKSSDSEQSHKPKKKDKKYNTCTLIVVNLRKNNNFRLIIKIKFNRRKIYKYYYPGLFHHQK